MSSKVEYFVKGMELDASVFKLLTGDSPDRKARKAYLESLSDTVMTVAESKELEGIIRNEKTIRYNGISITTKPDEENAVIRFDPDYQKVSIDGHEGSDLTFKLNLEKTFYVPDNGYFTDNYDDHLDLVQQAIEAFRCTCSIRFESAEAGGLEAGEVYQTHYVKGIQTAVDKMPA